MARSVAAVTLVALFLADAVWGASPGEKCAALKTTETGKKAAAKLRCHAKALLVGGQVSSACLAKADEKFAAKFARADATGGCATSADGQSIENKVDAFVDDVLNELPAATTSTTATTVTTSTGPTATTSTTIPTGPCDCGTPDPTRLQFTTTPGAGTCGTATRNDGSLYANLACGGLYSGAGSNSVPLPITEPDMGTSFLDVTACHGSFLVLGAATAAETLDTRTCTATGCLFGAPLPVPNPNAPAASYCVVRSVAADATGTGDCAAGTMQVSLPLHLDAFITGDLLTDAGHPGIQPCPLCEGGSCRGGPNDGGSCTPGTSALTGAYPTSHDCPPPPALHASDQVVDYAPGTAMVSRTAAATGSQLRVFCGFCRDGDVTGDFESPPHPCQSDAECTQPFEACQQRTGGAFGPAGGAVRTITESGAAGGDLRDHAGHGATMASIYCIPPSYSATLDAENDWPGAGATSSPGILRLLP